MINEAENRTSEKLYFGCIKRVSNASLFFLAKTISLRYFLGHTINQLLSSLSQKMGLLYSVVLAVEIGKMYSLLTYNDFSCLQSTLVQFSFDLRNILDEATYI